MAKQILIGIEEQNLNEVAHYLMIYFPYNEEMCIYTDTWMDELYENEYPLVSKGIWSGIINLKTHKLLNWKLEYGSLYLQAKVCDSGTYFLLDKDKKTICKIADYVPNGLIPEVDGCGDYIRLRINEDDMINWFEEPDFSDFMEDSEVVEKIDVHIKEESILYTKVEFTYNQLMAKLFRLPKFIQMEIGKALISNASEEFEKEE